MRPAQHPTPGPGRNYFREVVDVGISHGLGELRVKLHKAGDFPSQANRGLDELGGWTEDRGVRQVLAPLIGSDLKMSNWYGGEQVLSTSHFVTGRDTLFIKPVPAAPWTVLERGTKPHRIYPRKGKKALKFDNGHYAAWYDHPGSKPKYAWTKLKKAVQRQAGRQLDEEIHATYEEVFR